MVDIEKVEISTKPLTIRQMIAMTDLMDRRRKAKAAFTLFDERTNLTTEQILELTGEQAARLIWRLGTGLEQAAVLKKMSKSFE